MVSQPFCIVGRVILYHGQFKTLFYELVYLISSVMHFPLPAVVIMSKLLWSVMISSLLPSTMQCHHKTVSKPLYRQDFTGDVAYCNHMMMLDVDTADSECTRAGLFSSGSSPSKHSHNTIPS